MRALPLALRGLVRRYGEAGVRGVDLDVRAGELLAVVGPSGSGKSTLLRLVAGLERPDEGRVLVDEADITNAPPGDRPLGMTFDDAALYDHLSVRENLALALDRSGPRGADRVAAVDDALARCGASHLVGRRAESLSSGERRRVSLARAIARRPAILLLDEPLGHLDRASRVNLRDDIALLHRAIGATTLMVTHEHEDAIAIADRVAFLWKGRLLQVGTADDLLHQPAHVEVARGFGSPGLNVVRDDDGGWIAFAPRSVVAPATAATGDGWRAEATVETPADPAIGRLGVLRLANGERVRVLALARGEPREARSVVPIAVPAACLFSFTADGGRAHSG